MTIFEDLSRLWNAGIDRAVKGIAPTPFEETFTGTAERVINYGSDVQGKALFGVGTVAVIGLLAYLLIRKM